MTRIALLVSIILLATGSSWLVPARTCLNSRHVAVRSNFRLYAEGISVLPEDDASIRRAAEFMIDSFWLGSERLIEPSGADVTSIPASVRESLVSDQFLDLQSRFGERLGQRTLPACMLASQNSNGEIVGLLGLEILLFDSARHDMLSQSASETMLKDAVANLGPKQRRQYKSSTIEQVAEELLPANFKIVCCLSNLAVSPLARRQGIANKLCTAAGLQAKEIGYYYICLKVEDENKAAIELYTKKCGYTKVDGLLDCEAVRVDVKTGEFVKREIQSSILARKLE